MGHTETKSTRDHSLARLRYFQIVSKAPGLFHDGGGLYLHRNEHGVGRWFLRVSLSGRRVDRAVGMTSDISAEKAREIAARWRKLAREGIDPRREGRHQSLHSRAGKLTFHEAYETYFRTMREPGHKNKKAAAQWLSTADAYLFPYFGDTPIAVVTPAQVEDAIVAIWTTKHETATKVLERANATFKWAIRRGLRTASNPCDGLREQLAPTKPSKGLVRHHPSMPWIDVPEFLLSLRQRPRASLGALLAIEAVVLTAKRSQEVRLAEWSEFDFERKVWIIPASRMKVANAHDHIEPLTGPLVEVLRRSRSELGHERLVFPTAREGAPSDDALGKLLRVNMGLRDRATLHGFRASFRTWCDDHGEDDLLAEACLAHADSNTVRKAYRRSDMLKRRRDLMKRWARFCVGAGCA